MRGYGYCGVCTFDTVEGKRAGTPDRTGDLMNAIVYVVIIVIAVGGTLGVLMTHKISALQAENAALRQRYDRAQAQAEAYLEEKEIMRERQDGLIREHELLLDELGVAAGQAGRVAQVHLESMQLNNENEELQQTNAGLKVHNQELVQQHKELESVSSRLELERQALSQEAAGLRDENQRMNQKQAELETEVNDLTFEVKQLQSENELLKRENELLRRRVHSVHGRFGGWRKKGSESAAGVTEESN